MQISVYTTEECEKIATDAELRYVTKTTLGIHRQRQGRGFVYYDAHGKRVTEKNILARIRGLAIPPAYQDVWICAKANGHIQATGLDEKKRKQYIYHPLWNKRRQEQKFDSLIEFGKSLPQIRRHVQYQLNKTLILNKKQILCAILYLLDTAYVRIGNSLYARRNKSFGITTLRKKHLALNANQAILDFPGKNSQLWHIILKDKRLIKLLKKCEEIPGYELFKYYTEGGEISIISSQDVNAYLQSLTRHAFTAKTFRTWNACKEILYRLIKKNYSAKDLKATIEEVAMLLGHTAAICKKSYIDPEIIYWWESGRLKAWADKEKISIKNKDKLLLLWLEHRKIFLSQRLEEKLFRKK